MNVHTDTDELPVCDVCGERITFYAHQDYVSDELTMRYYHPNCCPTCAQAAP